MTETTTTTAAAPAPPKEEEGQKKSEVEKIGESISEMRIGKDAQEQEEQEEQEDETDETQTAGDLLAERMNSLEVLNSPYTSAKTFEELGLSKALLDGVYAQKFNRPSKIQGAALPVILSKDKHINLIAQAQSGTGKTAAFVLGMLSKVDTAVPIAQAICLSPTRELARQISEVAQAIGKFSSIQTLLVVPESSLPSFGKISQHVIVGTPGSVINALGKHLIDERAIRVLVLDEADVMLDQQGLGDQSVRVAKLLSKRCQYLLFSATFPPQVEAFAKRFVPEPIVQIRLKPKELVLSRISQFYIDCITPPKRFDVLCEIYKVISIGQSIIFVGSQSTAEYLGEKMSNAGHMVSVIHGGFSPDERDKILDKFRSGKTRVLISTNVLARGIDVLQVSLVINYDVPLDKTKNVEHETYLHRIGRTARYGRSGIAINLIGDPISREQIAKIAALIQHKIDELPMNKIEELDGMLRECRKRDEENLKLLKLEQREAFISSTTSTTNEDDQALPLKPQHPKFKHPGKHTIQNQPNQAQVPIETAATSTDVTAPHEKDEPKRK